MVQTTKGVLFRKYIWYYNPKLINFENRQFYITEDNLRSSSIEILLILAPPFISRILPVKNCITSENMMLLSSVSLTKQFLYDNTAVALGAMHSNSNIT